MNAPLAILQSGAAGFGRMLSITRVGHRLDPSDIVNLHHAYRRPEFRDRHYGSFHTSPSATADIEGVLMHEA
jgi:hypothetical protein